MAEFDWKKIVGAIAPTIGTALGGPAGGIAVKILADKLLGKEDATASDVANVLGAGLTAEQVALLKAAEQSFIVRMRELEIDVLRLNQQTEVAYMADTADARKSFAGKENVFLLGVCILVTFALLMGAVLVGCFLMMTGYFKIDPATAAICAGMIGTVVGYVAANAQQVVSYFYGSNKGSKDAGEQMGIALTAAVKASGGG